MMAAETDWICKIDTRYEGAVPGGNFRRREWNRLKKAECEELGLYGHREMRPVHCTAAGAREYSYTPRAGESGNARRDFWRSYTGRKQKDRGHRRPLVHSGEALQLSATARIVATSGGVKVRYPQLRKLNLRNPNSKIDMRAEFTAISRGDSDRLLRLFDKRMDRHLRRLRSSQRRRTR